MHQNLQRAWQLYELRRYSLALQEAYKFLGHYPESAEAFCLVALVHGKEKRERKALDAAGEAIQFSPAWSYPYYVRALVACWFNKYEDAKTCLAEALRIQPTHPDYYELLAHVHYTQGNLKTSLQVAEKGLSHAPEHVGCHFERGATLFALNRKKESEEEFRIILNMNAEHAQSQGYMGHFAVRRGAFAEALPLLRHALRDDPDWGLAQTAWKEALRGKYRLYGIFGRVRQMLFKKHGLIFLSVIYVCNVGLVTLLTNQTKEQFRDVIALILVGCVIISSIVYAFVQFTLDLYLALMSRFLLVYDPELRSSHDWKKTLRNWKEIIREFAFIIIILLVFAIGMTTAFIRSLMK